MYKKLNRMLDLFFFHWCAKNYYKLIFCKFIFKKRNTLQNKWENSKNKSIQFFNKKFVLFNYLPWFPLLWNIQSIWSSRVEMTLLTVVSSFFSISITDESKLKSKYNARADFFVKSPRKNYNSPWITLLS